MRTVAGAVTLALLAAACNGGSGGLSREEAQEIAEAALLALGDLPPGEEWTPDEPDDVNEVREAAGDIAACEGYVDFEDAGDDALAEAESPEFSSEGGSEVSNEVRVFEDEDRAAEVFAFLEPGGFRRCLSEAFNQLLAESPPPGGEFGEAVVEEGDPGDLGDEALGVEVTIPLTIQGETTPLVGQVAAIRVGPALNLFLAFGVGGPVESDELLETTVTRLEAAI